MLTINDTSCTNCQACYDVCPYYVIGKEKTPTRFLSDTRINADPADTALQPVRPMQSSMTGFPASILKKLQTSDFLLLHSRNILFSGVPSDHTRTRLFLNNC